MKNGRRFFSRVKVREFSALGEKTEKWEKTFLVRVVFLGLRKSGKMAKKIRKFSNLTRKSGNIFYMESIKIVVSVHIS